MSLDRSKPLRRPNGDPEYRSPEELLADAIAQIDCTKLPGCGKPIDLGDYFASGSDHRIAGRLLRDNQLLPQPLQYRRDAERCQTEATQYWAQAQAQLSHQRHALLDKTAPLTAPFPTRAACMATLGWDEWPDYLAEPTAQSGLSLPQWRHRITEVDEHIHAYNRRLLCCTDIYRTLIEKANACVDRLNEHVLFSGQLTPGLSYLPSTSAEAERELSHQIAARPLPTDWPARIEAYYRSVHPSPWRRLFSR